MSLVQPRRTKYRKQQRGHQKGATTKGATVSFGGYALKARSSGMLTARQIEAARRAITRHIKRGGKVWIRVFPDRPITQKGAQTPMGSGKGAVDHYSASIRAGRVLFEMDGVSEQVAKEAMRLASHKLSVKTRFIVA